MGKRELVAWLSLSTWCLMIIVPWVCLQFAIVVFPDHTILHVYLQYYINMSNSYKESFTFLKRDVAFSTRD